MRLIEQYQESLNGSESSLSVVDAEKENEEILAVPKRRPHGEPKAKPRTHYQHCNGVEALPKYSSNNENHYIGIDTTSTQRRIKDFAPDQLRRETRQIMKQLEINPPKNANPTNSSSLLVNRVSESPLCQSKTHMHICHCSSEKCARCYPLQNFNFANIPKQRPRSSVRFDKAVGESGLTEIQRPDKSKVIYRPSGSTVVVQKHVTR